MKNEAESSFISSEPFRDRRRGLTIPTYSDMAIVVPCYNEEKRLDFDAFATFMGQYKDIHVVFVNDGSTDDTITILKSISQRFPEQATILNLEQNRGKAEAVRQGLLHAIKEGNRYVGYWDADLATSLSAITEFGTLIRRDGEHTVVIGVRLRLLGHNIQRKLSRRIFSRAFNLVARASLRLNIRDTQCGAKLFEVDEDLRASLRQPFEAGWLFDIELLHRLIARKKTRAFIYEHPLFSWSEVDGSKVSMIKSLRAVVQVCMLGIRGAKP